MALFSPPIVNESNPLALFSIESVQTCRVMPDSSAAIVLVNSMGSPSFVGTFALYIPNEQSEGPLTVICRVTAADGMDTTNQTTLSVLGKYMYQYYCVHVQSNLNYLNPFGDMEKSRTRIPYSGKFSYGANFRIFRMLHPLYENKNYEILNMRNFF
jgi:hypothetical protein